MSLTSPSDTASRSLPPYFVQVVKVKFSHHPLIILTKHVYHYSNFWGSRCDSKYVLTISLKLVHFDGDFGIRFWLMTQAFQGTLHHQLVTSHFEIFRPCFPLNLPISANIYPTYISRLLNKKILQNKAKRPDVFNDSNYDTQRNKLQRQAYQNTKCFWWQRPTGLTHANPQVWTFFHSNSLYNSCLSTA